MSQLTKVFSLNRKGFSLPGGVAVGGILLVIWFAIAQLNQQKYLVSIIFAVLTTALSDPGGGYGNRARGMGAFGLGGAAVTALAFFVGAHAWGFVVFALFAVTLLAGLAVKFGLHRFSVGLLLNIWFVVAVVLPSQLPRRSDHNQRMAPGAGVADRIGRVDRVDRHRVVGEQAAMAATAGHRHPR